MAKLLAERPVLAHGLKQGLMIVIVGLCLYYKEEFTLVLLAVAFGLVVLNNVYLVVIKLITKQRHTSPLLNLSRCLKIPEALSYPFICLIIFGTAWIVAGLLKG